MDYGALLVRAWNIIWRYKFLILLGVLVALGSTGSGGLGPTGVGSDQASWDFEVPQPGPRGVPSPIMPGGLSILVILLIFALILFIAIPLWVLSILSRGGLIAGVNAIDAGGTSSFGQALRAGWEKGWRLLGIAIVPTLPGVLLVFLALAGAVAYIGFPGVSVGSVPYSPINAVLGALGIATICILAPVLLVLRLLHTFANRACMLEDVGVFMAYKRGASVLLENLGSALMLFLFQILISVGFSVVMFFAGLLVALCCLLWPVLIVIQGTVTAYFSTLWTLAWRQWMGEGEFISDAPFVG